MKKAKRFIVLMMAAVMFMTQTVAPAFAQEQAEPAVSVEAPAEKKAEAPAEKKAEAPAEKKAEAPAEKKAEAPAEKKEEAPAPAPAPVVVVPVVQSAPAAPKAVVAVVVEARATETKEETKGDVTVKTTTTTEDDGNGKVTETVEKTWESKEGADVQVSGKATTKTETTTTDKSETTKVESEWSDSETSKVEGETQQTGENTTQKTDVTTTVEKTGEEKIEESTTEDRKGNVTEEGSAQGSETVDTTIVTETTTTTEDVVLEEEIGEPVTEEEETVFGEEGDMILDDEGEWEKDPENDEEGDWTTVEGSVKETEGEKIRQELDAPNVKLEMEAPTENEDFTTDSEKVVVKVEDIMPEAGEGETVEPITDENGNVIGYKIIKLGNAQPDEDNSNEIVEDETGEGPVKDGDPVVESHTEHLKPEYQEGTREGTTEAGDAYTEKTEALEDGTGYKVTTTVTKNEAADLDPTTEESAGADKFVNAPEIPEDAVWQNEDKTSYIQLPEKPEASESTDANGNKTVVTVEELKDELSGQVIGYKKTVTVTDKNGKLISRESESKYGTITSFNTTVTTDPETRQTVTVTETTVKGLKQVQKYIEQVRGYQEESFTRVGEEDIYQLVETNEGLVFMYNGKMYKVNSEESEAIASLVATGSRDGSEGSVLKDNFITDTDDSDLRINGDKVAGNKTISGYYTDQIIGSGKAKDENPNDDMWAMIGYGLFSDFSACETRGKNHQTKLFKLERRNKDGSAEYQYVYCVELGTDTSPSTVYGSTEYDNTVDENGNKITWNNGTKADGTIGELRSVCLNGFWGTEDGLGSLEAVKDLMRRNGLAEQADKLTAGMALTATQVAIWEFGADEDGRFGGEGYDFVKLFNHHNNSGPSGNPNAYIEVTDEEKQQIIIALRDLLVKLAKSEVNEETGESAGLAEVIDKDDVKGGSITLKSKEETTDADGNDVYNADVGFTLDVSTSSINGDLKVSVYQGEKMIGFYRLSGDDTQDQSEAFYRGKVYPDASGTYTLKDLQLSEGVIIDLQLTGVQHLDDGVFLFDNSSYQDFVGLSKLEKEIDMTFSMEFNVIDPELQNSQKTWEETKTNKTAYKKTRKYHTETNGAKTGKKVTVTTRMMGTVTQMDSIAKETAERRDWEIQYNSYTPGGRRPGIDPNEHGKVPPTYTVPTPDGYVIPDSMVPLANVPQTGDVSGVYAMMSMVSLCGIVLLMKKRVAE